MFNGFIRKAVGSCVDYDTDSVLLDEQLPFAMDDEGEERRQPYARNLLKRAQLKHRIFEDESVIKAFYEAEKAHRGQVSIKKAYNFSLYTFVFIAITKRFTEN